RVDFRKIDEIIRKQFTYVDEGVIDIFSMGFARLVGNSNKSSVKIDMFYTDPYIREFIETEGIRMASVEDIAAMKLEVILRAGRKKDFWDIHQLMESYSLEELLILFGERYPYHREEDLLDGLTTFSDADNQLDPICLKGKFWELIKYDIEEIVKKYRASH
ncbi:MAG: nucleotidyl transferase AbiEii/AbiGii toxin family protein, partial [Bacteroidales bacterium]|nr:nucleotidyl transferase AbiEii/AbiGii toxin family protein [Bacteroidales bacterium]